MKRKTLSQHLKGTAGFTLIEVAVALSVLSIGLLSMASVIPLAKRDMLRSDQRTHAVFLAQESAEWLHGLLFSDPLLTAGTHVDGTFNQPGYLRTWTVADNTPLTNVKRVTVQITRNGVATANTRQNATVVFLHAQAGH